MKVEEVLKDVRKINSARDALLEEFSAAETSIDAFSAIGKRCVGTN